MERVVRIRDRTQHGFHVFATMPEVLRHFAPEGEAWSWQLAPGAQFVLPREPDPETVRIALTSDDDGVTHQFTWPEIVQFSDRIVQAVWAEFTAWQPSQHPLGIDASAADIGRAAIAGLSAVDSSYWVVGGPASVVERLCAAFTEVDELSPDQWDRADD